MQLPATERVVEDGDVLERLRSDVLDSLNGFRVYWPNRTVGVCARNADGQSYAQNIRFEPDGSINFFVGILASHPGSFSPCVEAGSEPEYAEVPGTEKRPHWPTDFRPYAL